MSIDLVAAALWLDLPPARKLVLVALCDRANVNGECWPSRREISFRASVNVRNVTPHLQALEADGWIAETGPKPNRAGMTTHRWLDASRIIEEGDKRRNAYRAGDESACAVGDILQGTFHGEETSLEPSYTSATDTSNPPSKKIKVLPRTRAEELMADLVFMAELRERFTDRDVDWECGKWMNYVEETPPKNFKLSLKNWLERSDPVPNQDSMAWLQRRYESAAR